MKTRNALLVLATALFAAAAAAEGNHAGGQGHDDSAIGQPGLAAKANRTVRVVMDDTMRVTPASITVIQGETIRFVVSNAGKVKHEFVLGTEKELNEHYEQMKKFPQMEHADSNMATVAPGQTGEVIWHFTRAGPVSFACLYPGHYGAGMKGLIEITSSKTNRKENGNEHTH
jgi:uncharacterized cupredoxin-like copper-binding protein